MNDRKLPGLERALDVGAMQELFVSLWRRNPAWSKNSFQELQPQVLKYTPGKRCVIEYQLWSAEQAFVPRRVIGKIYRKNRGEIIFANWRRLWEAAVSASAVGELRLGMPEPLAYLPELGMVLQSAVPGRALADFSEHEDLMAAMPSVAQNLAALHNLRVDVGEKKTLDDHLKKYCHPGPAALSEACPEAAPLVKNILSGLASNENLPLCPIHGDLNLTQIFIAEKRAFFIDFDGLCLSHPALDLGNFLVTLQAHFGAAGAMLQKKFLESYKACRSLRMLTGLRAYQAFAYLRRAVICARAPAVADWRQQVRQLLEAGSAFLESEVSSSCR